MITGFFDFDSNSEMFLNCDFNFLIPPLCKGEILMSQSFLLTFPF